VQADALHAAQALVVHADGPRVVDDLICSFEQDGVDAEAAEGVRNGGADGTGAHDGDLGPHDTFTQTLFVSV
jgi:hypothetical protein